MEIIITYQYLQELCYSTTTTNNNNKYYNFFSSSN